MWTHAEQGLHPENNLAILKMKNHALNHKPLQKTYLLYVVSKQHMLQEPPCDMCALQ